MIQPPAPWPWPIPGPRLPGQPRPNPPAGNPIVPNPLEPSVEVPIPGVVEAVPGVAPALDGIGPPSNDGAAPPHDWKEFLIWIAALAVLWLILTASKEAGYSSFAHGMAGLILFGALLAMGPKAIENAQKLLE